MDIINQVKWLTYKYALLDIRGWKVSILRIILPLLGAALILLFVKSPFVQTQISSHTPEQQGAIPKCTEYVTADNKTCVSLYYYDGTNNTTDINNILTMMGEQNGENKLVLGTDIVRVTSIRSLDGFLNFLYSHSNETYGAIYFESVDFENYEFNYTVFYNSSSMTFYNMDGQSRTVFTNNQYLNIETSIERAITTIALGKSSDDTPITLNSAFYPTVVNQDGYSRSWDISITILYCVVTFNSLVVLVNLVSDKEEGIRGQMKFSGLKDISYWFCEIVNHTFFGFLGVLLFVIFSAPIPGLELFHNCNPFVLILILFVWQINSNALACVVATLISLRKTANIMACILFAIGLTITLVFSLTDSGIYNSSGSTLLFMSSIPWFSFTKVFMDIKMITIGPINPFDPNLPYCWIFNPSNGDYFEFSYLTRDLLVFDVAPYTTSNICSGAYTDDLKIPTTLYSLVVLFLESLVFYILAFYFDKIISTDKYRAKEHFLFFLRRIFKKSKNINIHAEDALFIEHLSKTYKRFSCSSNGTLALKPFLLKTASNSVLCILGPNGAGKTTTITCLTGLTTPSEGDAYLFGCSIISDMDEIRKNMGVCPQFDLLWDNLTAWEHMQILNGFKPSQRRMSNEGLYERLTDVRLFDVRNDRSKSFSGGMKRRLSVAISTLGNPLILFLDEPTTGMDPDNRQYVWKLIKRFKENRLIILTTHSMEEADHLGDVVGIMAKGKLRCYGKPLELKSRFGLGFRITLSTKLEEVEKLKSYIQQILPGAQLRGENAGSLVYNLPDAEMDETCIRFFERLEKGAIPVTDWGIHNTTLEDVYLSISRKVMGQDISFQGAQMFDRDERQMFKDTVSRYEDKIQLVEKEINELRSLLEANGIDHSIVERTKAKKKFQYIREPSANDIIMS